MGVFLDVFFPPVCAACSQVLPMDVAFCVDCSLETETTPEPRCPRCSEPGEHCRRCARETPVFDRAFAPFLHEGAIAKAIHQFKYEDHPELTRQLGRLMHEEARGFLDQAPLLISPIPLHRSRRIQRRYDQAALLAVELARL
ncbi:MAG: ComF family protein, partial [Myxococcaceae bacterium]